MRNQAAQQKSADEIQEEIAQTRAELDGTLEQIGRRLSPEEMKERAVEYARDTAGQAVEYARDTAGQIGDVVQRNPLTVAVAGTVLIATAIARHRAGTRRAQLQEDQLRVLWDRIASAVESRAQGLRLPTDLRGATHLAHDVRDGLAHALDEAAVQSQRLGSVANEGAKRVVASLEQSSREQPLLTLLGAVAAGAVLTTLLRR